ncbi:LTA synthase family protein [Clostridium chauvoei]|uniref:LTA synthase family protein n=2 Tax=Clostridium chauvoei TaxID=46867 RepID=A0ABD4RKD1_9CLOT|nr:LTA synthase family protein [Clostridium chauvoei]MBX7284096.1 LTA synthase family protein [Clostridium chauvoei]MBX7286613.1 LTA synthase family protein [Clostridium chauvoei]MBX7289144.1 LTA synthase family protein [Clostridium chauvoei]MBX7291660.1 LTA synthase family protein [Clostridium chauvoei]
MIPLVSIVIKGIIFQGFVINQNPYELDMHMGHVVSKSYLLYYYAFALLFLSFALLFKGRGRVIYLFVVDLIITILILVDLGYFRGFLTMPSALLLMQTSNMDNMGSTIMSMFSNKDYLLFIDFIIMGIFIFITRKSHFQIKRRAPLTFIISLIISILYIAYVPFNLFVLGNKEVKNASIFDNYDPTNTARYLSPVGYHIFDVYNVYKDSKPYELTDEEQAQVNKFFEIKKENLPNNEYAGLFKGKNLIVIQVESLESFVIDKKINDQEITPVLNNLVNTGIYFPNIYEQVNEGTSSDCDLMINTSMFPLRRGSTFFRYPNTTYNSLPLLLEEQGYETSAIHPDKGSFWNYTNGLTGIGFKKFTDYYSFDIDEQIGMGLSDESYFRQVVPMLKQTPNPFYAFTVTLTSHGPFDLPDKYRTLGLNEELGNSELGGYFESVKYTDKQIGMFLKKLDEEGILDNTVVVIEGDHTGVHKYYNHSIEALSEKEDWYLDNGHHTIPFIIWSKDVQYPKKSDIIGGQIDIMPTLLYLMGIPNEKYEGTALGRNLLNTNRSFAVTTNLDIFENGLTEEQREIYKSMVELSDKMIRANYFNKE